MRIRQTVTTRIHRRGRAADALAATDASVAANVGEPGSVVRSSHRQRVVQRSHRTAQSGGDRPSSDGREPGATGTPPL